MREEKFEVTLHTQTDGQRVVALILPNMPLELIHGDKSVTAVGLSAEEAKVLARMLLEKASELIGSSRSNCVPRLGLIGQSFLIHPIIIVQAYIGPRGR